MKYVVTFNDADIGFTEIDAYGLYVVEGALVFFDHEQRVVDALAPGAWKRCTPVKGSAYASNL